MWSFGNFGLPGNFFKNFKTKFLNNCNKIVEQNPDCLIKDTCPTISIVMYIRADGENDTVHFLIDILRTLSLTIVKTKKDVAIHANYTGFLDSKIEFTETPLYIFSTVFNKVRLHFKLNNKLFLSRPYVNNIIENTKIV